MLARKLALSLLCAAVLPITVLAQDKPVGPFPHFKLVYRLLQINEAGKVADAHTYSTMVVANDMHADMANIRSKDNVPIATGGGLTVSTQFQYREVGMNIDTSQAKLDVNQLSANVSADFSTVVKDDPRGKGLNAPTIRNLVWKSDVVVVLDKPTIIFSTDNLNDAGKTELELTATPIK